MFPEIWTAEDKNQEQRAQARDQGKLAVNVAHRDFPTLIARTRIDAELELLRQAMYTDPADQSVWLYHTWLVEIGEPEWRGNVTRAAISLTRGANTGHRSFSRSPRARDSEHRGAVGGGTRFKM